MTGMGPCAWLPSSRLHSAASLSSVPLTLPSSCDQSSAELRPKTWRVGTCWSTHGVFLSLFVALRDCASSPRVENRCLGLAFHLMSL